MNARRSARAAAIACAASVLLIAPRAGSQSRERADVFDDPRVVEPEVLRARVAAGETRLPVIVNLAAPEDVRTFGEWRDRVRVAARRAAIGRLESSALDVLPAAEFTVQHRLQNQATVTGRVTVRGLAMLLANPVVESVEVDHEVTISTAQGIALMNGNIVRSEFDGSGISVGIADTGIEYTHPALGNGGFPNSKVIGGYDFGDGDADPMDQNGHGTEVAGLVAGAIIPNGDYVGGVAPGARLYALKIVAGGSSSGSDGNEAAAWDWCVTHQNDDPARPIRVINTSFAGGRFSSICDGTRTALARAANNATAAGITLFCAAGNDGYCNAVGSPACIANAVSVGAVYDAPIGAFSFCVSVAACVSSPNAGCSATGRACFDNPVAADQVTCFSNSANILDLLAPSFNASVPHRGGGYTSAFGGTSAASPYAAGAAAILLHAAQVNGVAMEPADVRAVLVATGDSRTDPKSGIAKPRVNIGRAVAYVGTWVDFAYVGTEYGTPAHPFDTLTDGLAAVPAGGNVTVRSGTTSERPTISKPMTLRSAGGTVVIGQ